MVPGVPMAPGVLGGRRLVLVETQRMGASLTANLGNSGINKDGVDGDFGQMTEDALFKAKQVRKIALKVAYEKKMSEYRKQHDTTTTNTNTIEIESIKTEL
jgi:hypothetical protein